MQPLPMNEFVQQNLAEIGIQVEFEVVDWNTLINIWRAGAKHDNVHRVARLSWNAVDADGGHPLEHDVALTHWLRELDYQFRVARCSLIDQFRQITSSVALLIFAISSIGLLVGGVGVMNIMLMSVTQRTREIGVRKAIGARRSDVIWQFLTEAIVLTGSGDVIGVLLGAGISLLINLAVPSLPSYVPLWAIVLAVAVSMGVGLFFGMYPAIKAARLDPVEALRYE